MNHATAIEEIHVWDRFVRAFHWTLVSCILFNYFVMDDGETLHRWLGYTASALVCARIVWGFVGSRYARFSDFFPTPGKIKRHLQHLRAGTHDEHPGHNPVAAVMIFVLMSGLITPIASMPGWAQAITRLLPPRYFIGIMRAVYLKGTALGELWGDYAALALVQD